MFHRCKIWEMERVMERERESAGEIERCSEWWRESEKYIYFLWTRKKERERWSKIEREKEIETETEECVSVYAWPGPTAPTVWAVWSEQPCWQALSQRSSRFTGMWITCALTCGAGSMRVKTSQLPTKPCHCCLPSSNYTDRFEPKW